MSFFKALFGKKDQSYKIGDRVRFKDDGPITGKPADTGYHKTVILEQKGRKGTIVRFNEKGFPFVKWDADTYKIFQGMEGSTIWYDGTVELKEFTICLHPDYIEPVTAKPSKKSKSKSDYKHVDAAKSDPAIFECEKCHTTGSHKRITDQYAGDLWLCPSCGYKTYRSKGI